MDSLLSDSRANFITSELMKYISYNINIMNNKGIIIASGNESRVGTLHKGALEAIGKKGKVIIHKDTETERRGINDVIIWDKQVIGVVGITGVPDEIEPLLDLVKFIIEILLQRTTLLSNTMLAKEKFLLKLVGIKDEYSPLLIEEAKEYHIDLRYPNYAVYHEKKEVLRQLFPEKTLFEWQEGYVVFTNEGLVKNPLTLSGCCISKNHSMLHQSLEEIQTLLVYIDFFHLDRNLFYDIGSVFLAGVVCSKFPFEKEVFDRVLLLSEAQIETLKCLYNFNGNKKEVSNHLYIHRNTLRYRITSINNVLMKNVETISDLFEVLCYLIWNKKRQETLK